MTVGGRKQKSKNELPIPSLLFNYLSNSDNYIITERLERITHGKLRTGNLLLSIEFFHNSRLILDEFNKIKISKKLT